MRFSRIQSFTDCLVTKHARPTAAGPPDAAIACRVIFIMADTVRGFKSSSKEFPYIRRAKSTLVPLHEARNTLGMATLPDILRQARERLGINKAELARRLKVSRATVSDWEKGATAPTRKRAPQIAKILGIPIGSLQPLTAPGLESVDTEKTLRKIRIIGWEELTHLERSISGPHRGEMVDVDADTPDDAVSLRVMDQSMSPDFNPGDIIIISRLIEPLDDDAVVVTFANGEKYLRFYQSRGRDSSGSKAFDLRAKDAFFKTITVNGNNPTSILAVVVEHRKKLRKR